ncbi:MAG: TRAM domain-containing protein, partial [Gammaproteobacteria bacterium]
MARRRRKKLPSEPIDVMIHGMGHDGRGVGKTDAGKTVFVDMALPGEKVTMQYTYTRSQFDEGRAIAVLEAASERVEPECPHFGICGGCSMQHLAHKAQIEYK